MLENVRKMIYDSLVNFGATIKSLYVKKGNIVNNLLSADTDKPLAANQGRVLKTDLDKKKFTFSKETYVSANSTLQLELTKGKYIITFGQGGAWDITGMAFATMTDTQGSSVCYKICGSTMFLEKMEIALNASDKTMAITNSNGANVILCIYSI